MKKNKDVTAERRGLGQLKEVEERILEEGVGDSGPAAAKLQVELDGERSGGASGVDGVGKPQKEVDVAADHDGAGVAVGGEVVILGPLLSFVVEKRSGASSDLNLSIHVADEDVGDHGRIVPSNGV